VTLRHQFPSWSLNFFLSLLILTVSIATADYIVLALFTLRLTTGGKAVPGRQSFPASIKTSGFGLVAWGIVGDTAAELKESRRRHYRRRAP
jgi:hypothetical protein